MNRPDGESNRAIQLIFGDVGDVQQLAARALETLENLKSDAEREAFCSLVKPDLGNFLEENGWTEVVDRRADYGIRLATDPDGLLYEEMVQLFAVCDQIAALQLMGATMAPEKETAFTEAISTRLQQDAKSAAAVAMGFVEDWKRNWLCYSLVLGR